MRVAGLIVVVFLLSGIVFGAVIFAVPVTYAAWKQCECWLRGPDGFACWELDLLRYRDGGGPDGTH